MAVRIAADDLSGDRAHVSFVAFASFGHVSSHSVAVYALVFRKSKCAPRDENATGVSAILAKFLHMPLISAFRTLSVFHGTAPFLFPAKVNVRQVQKAMLH